MACEGMTWTNVRLPRASVFSRRPRQIELGLRANQVKMRPSTYTGGRD